MASALNSKLTSPGSSPGRGHCVVFLGNTRYSHSASLHPGVQMGSSEFNAKGNPSHLRRSENNPSRFMV